MNIPRLLHRSNMKTESKIRDACNGPELVTVVAVKCLIISIVHVDYVIISAGTIPATYHNVTSSETLLLLTTIICRVVYHIHCGLLVALLIHIGMSHANSVMGNTAVTQESNFSARSPEGRVTSSMTRAVKERWNRYRAWKVSEGRKN